MSKEQLTEETTQAEVQETTQENGLNISDLNTLRAIIDLASSRGAFKTSEMQAIGATYNKLSAFLDAVAKQAEENQTSEGE